MDLILVDFYMDLHLLTNPLDSVHVHPCRRLKKLSALFPGVRPDSRLLNVSVDGIGYYPFSISQPCYRKVLRGVGRSV